VSGMPRLAGKRAVVTGGASGIGFGIAVTYAEEGAEVTVLDVSPGFATAPNATLAFIRADVSDESAVTAAFGEILGRGPVDILVNNAGVVGECPLAQMPSDEWDRVMNVNLRGAFLCTRAVLPTMIERGWGRVINMASQIGQIGGDTMTHYSASKAGLIGLTKALAREVSQFNVLVNAIAPGPIETRMLAGESPDWKTRKLGELPIGRFGQVAEVVPSAVFLASEDSSYYVGQTLGPNGGDVML
jgi:3-oxoacyl-[acyl-carrier protein] reductase